MLITKLTYEDIRVSSNLNDDAKPLYNECKVKSNLILFKEVNKKSTVSLSAQELGRTTHTTLKTLLYTCNNVILYPNDRLNVGTSIQDALEIGLMQNKILNRSIRRMYKHFDHTKPIYHISLAPHFIVNLAEPDKLRILCKNALIRAGTEKGVIFGLDIGHGGEPHFHALVQGYLKPHDAVLNRTGWSYKKYDDDRCQYMHMDEENPKFDRGFYTTARYNLRKNKFHKRAYLMI